MKEEYGEFKDMMAGVNQQNMMNVNFAPINNNAQNWVNINTEMESEVDVNVNTWGKKDSGKKEHDDEEQGHGHVEVVGAQGQNGGPLATHQGAHEEHD